VNSSSSDSERIEGADKKDEEDRFQGTTYEKKHLSDSGSKLVNPEFLPSPGDDNPFISPDADGKNKRYSYGSASSTGDKLEISFDQTLPSGNPHLRNNPISPISPGNAEQVNDAIFVNYMSGVQSDTENPFQNSTDSK